MNSYTKYNNFMQNYFFVRFTSRRSIVNNRPEIQKSTLHTESDRRQVN